MNRLRIVAVLGYVLAWANASWAQTGTIQGRVTDARTGDPMPGVNIVVMGTTWGTATDNQGRYTLAVRPGTYTIQARFLGYETASRSVTVRAGEAATVNFALRERAIDLEEVVVTGVAREAARKEIGASIATLDVRRLEDAPILNMSQLLQARAPGVSVLPGGGKTGEGTKILIRGPVSVTQGIQPIIYVDGVRIDNSTALGVWTGGYSWTGLDDLNPEDIERVEIVKGAASSTIYGTEAAAGVIQIFTRTGRTGAPRWEYRSELGQSTTPLDWWNVSLYSPWFYENFVRTGQILDQQLSVSGGQAGFNYYASAGLRNQDGVLKGNREEARHFRLNLQLLPRQNLIVRFNTGYATREVFFPQDANNIYGIAINGLGGGPRGRFMRPEEALNVDVRGKSGRFTGSFSAEYRPMEGFNHRVTLGADIVNYDNTEYFPYGGVSPVPLGRKVNYRRDATTISFEYATSFSRRISPWLNVNATAGWQYYDRAYGSNTATGRDFPTPGLSVVAAAAVREGTESRLNVKSAGAFAQAGLGLWEVLFLNVGTRVDGHSAFGKDYPYHVYPSANASILLSGLRFWELLRDFWIPSLRLRAAYGTAGRQPGTFDAVRTWQPISAADGKPGVTTLNLGNPKLGPEVSHERELGVDASFLGDRLALEFTWYTQETRDALLSVQYPPSQGFPNPQLENRGKLRNKGVELSATLVALNTSLARWSFQANFSTNYNKVLDLAGMPEISVQWSQKHKVGYPVAAYFEDRYILKDGKVGLASQLLRNPDGTLPSGWDYIGPSFPIRTAQLSTDLTLFRNLNVRVLFDHASGHYLESTTFRWLMNWTVTVNDPVLPDKAGQTVGLWAHWDKYKNDPVMQEYIKRPWGRGGPRGNVVVPADYWRLREVAVSYRVPESFLSRFVGQHVRSVMVYASGRNLWRWFKFPMLEVESAYNTPNDLSQQEYFGTPVPRQIVFGLRIGF